jgi:hypothetical protein
MKNGLHGEAVEDTGGGRYKSGFLISPAPAATLAALAASEGRFGRANRPKPAAVLVGGNTGLVLLDMDALATAEDSAARMATMLLGLVGGGSLSFDRVGCGRCGKVVDATVDSDVVVVPAVPEDDEPRPLRLPLPPDLALLDEG